MWKVFVSFADGAFLYARVFFSRDRRSHLASSPRGSDPSPAGLPRSLVPALDHRQNPRLPGICQIRQDRGIQLMMLPQTDFVHAHIGEPSVRIDSSFIFHAMVHDLSNHLGADPQPPCHFLFARSDQNQYEKPDTSTCD